MVGTAVYPALGSKLPAACSHAIVTGLLRDELGFEGVILSDDLNTAGVRPTVPFPEAAVRAVKAGIDVIYVSGVDRSGTDPVGRKAYAALLEAARQGVVSQAQLQASYDRVLELKREYAAAS
jgi:beta-N-acetylhexosaminidase